MTLLEMVNKVMRGLRENTAANVTTGYAAVIAQFVNEAKQDIEDKGPWRALRTLVTGTMVSGTAYASLTTTTNERSYPLYDSAGRGQAWITTADEESRLTVVDHRDLLDMRYTNPDADNAKPQYVSFAKSNDGLTAWFFPTPDANYTFTVHMIVPQDDLSAATDTITIPATPVWSEALCRAIEERGDEFSGPVQRYVDRAREAYYTAMMADFGLDDITFRQE